MAFGLGAGACFYYVTIEDQDASPTRWFRDGRTARPSRRNFDRADRRRPSTLRTFEPRDGDAWESARSEIDSGNPGSAAHGPVSTSTTTANSSAHFPGHAVVLAGGYDEEEAYLSDTGFEAAADDAPGPILDAGEAQRPSRLSARRPHVHALRARSPPESCAPRSPPQSSARRGHMVEPEFREFSGLGAVDRLAEEAGSWPEVADDGQWCARFGYQVIERRGTGGGAFRLMYSRFLEEAGRSEASLAAGAAARWTELASAFRDASESDSSATAPPGERSAQRPGRSPGRGASLDLAGRAAAGLTSKSNFRVPVRFRP